MERGHRRRYGYSGWWRLRNSLRQGLKILFPLYQNQNAQSRDIHSVVLYIASIDHRFQLHNDEHGKAMKIAMSVTIMIRIHHEGMSRNQRPPAYLQNSRQALQAATLEANKAFKVHRYFERRPLSLWNYEEAPVIYPRLSLRGAYLERRVL